MIPRNPGESWNPVNQPSWQLAGLFSFDMDLVVQTRIEPMSQLAINSIIKFEPVILHTYRDRLPQPADNSFIQTLTPDRMDSRPLGSRVPDRILRDLAEFMIVEGVDRSTAVEKILAMGLSEWRKERALRLLGQGSITFNRAAQLAGVSVWDMMELVVQRRVEWVRLTADEMDRESSLANRIHNSGKS